MGRPATAKNAAVQIDSLTYSYSNSSTANQTFNNKLQAVNDAMTISGLGDFENKHAGTTDYAYDANGNLLRDLNKRIGVNTTNGITYNHLNLPAQITVRKPDGTIKGTITYTYDATGNKIRKQVVETGVTIGATSGVTVTTITNYRGPCVYESKTYNPIPAGYANYTHQLQFFGHEEGRVRAIRALPNNNLTGFAYDYMLKDHLGNVRMVLTDQKDTTVYHALSFEGATGSAEVNNQNSVWENANGQPINVTAVRTTSPGVLQNSGLQPPPLTNALLVCSSTGKVGAGKLIKVMAGDRVHTSVQYYYPTVGTQPQGDGLNSLLGGLASVITNSTGAGGLLKTASTTLANGVGVDPLVIAFFNNQNNNPVSGKPRAYLNVLFFDDQFNMDANASQFRQVGTGTMNPNNPGQIGFMAGSAALAKKSGYCYIYISNESDDLVYFDNFTLAHERSSLMEETHYYPFGLIMAGISSKASGKVENKLKYNGIEHNTDFDLNMYDAFYRNLDPQIGRFWQIDPEAEMLVDYSPYASMYNNPISNVDPLGNFGSRFGAWLHKVFNGGGKVGKNEYGEWYVNKTRTESTDDGGVAAVGYRYYGKGRNQYSTAAEKIIRDDRIQTDIRMNGGVSRYTNYDSEEEAGGAAFTMGVGMWAPNLTVKPVTTTINAIQLSNRGKKIVQTIKKTISVQKQIRHIIGTAKEGGGYLKSMADAQKVLDAVHSGEAVFLGTTKAGQPVFRFSGVSGTNVNLGVGISEQSTNVFIIKGTVSPSVVPTNPVWRP